MFNNRYIKNRAGLEIYTESLGDRKAPAVVLAMGAMNQGLFWYDAFCERLSNAGLFVIRYDHRDTGFSSVVDFGKNPYDLDDLTNDVIDIVDGYDLSKAHFVGLSMGGYLGQVLGANFPERVATLTLISTTADHRPYMDATMGNFSNIYELPRPSRQFVQYIEKSKASPPRNDEEFREAQIEGWKIFFARELNKEDLAELIRLIDLSDKRNRNRFSPFNHGPAVANSHDRLGLIKKIKAPTYIFHGENDPCFPPEHARFLQRNIPGSKLEMISGMGHMFTLSESMGLAAKILSNIMKA